MTSMTPQRAPLTSPGREDSGRLTVAAWLMPRAAFAVAARRRGARLAAILALVVNLLLAGLLLLSSVLPA